MDIASKISINLTKSEAEEILRNGAVQLLREQLGIQVSPNDIDVDFTTTTDYGYMDRGPGTPVVSGVRIAVKRTKEQTRHSHNSLAFQIASVEADGRQYGDH